MSSLRATLARRRHKVLPALLLVAGLVLAAVYRQELVSWFSGKPIATAPSTPATEVRAGPFELGLNLAPEAPREKGNSLFIRIVDDKGQPIEGAEVKVVYRMPPMGSMQEMRGQADISKAGEGRYEARFDLPMGGSWTLDVGVKHGEQSGEATFNVTVGTPGLTVTGSTEGAPGPQPMPQRSTHRLDDQTLARLREAFAGYEQIRSLLARDKTDGIESYAPAIEHALEAAGTREEHLPDDVRRTVDDARSAAERLAGGGNLQTVRGHFGDLTKHLVALASSDARLTEGLHVFRCPMAEGFQKWFQPSPELENPYMGTKMPGCGEPSEWSGVKAAHGEHDHAPSEAGGSDVAHYTCPMHPSVKQASPGKCPICGMDLTPVAKKDLEAGTISVDPVRRQRIGVRTAPVTRRDLTLEVRAVGEVVVDETGLSDVNLRMGGWVQKLAVNKTGQRVSRGQTLFTLYSPELYAAQMEHLAAYRRLKDGTSETLAGLASSSRQRLRLLGMTDSQVRDLEQRGEALEHVPIIAPASGHVIEKNVVEGARVEAGMLVYRIADLSRIWIDAEVYESDLPYVKTGQSVLVELPYAPGKTYDGKVDFIYPTLQGQTRTGRVRVVLKNPELELKPDMYANVRLEIPLGERLVVPDSAVVYTGARRLVFVDLGDARLQPKAIELGAHVDGFYEVTDGLSEGDVIVTSGNFLIAAESRIRSATKYWESTSDSE